MFRCLCAIGLCLLISPLAKAEIVITVGDTVALPGGTALIDIYVASDDLINGDELSIANFAFDLQPISGGTRLEFTTVQPQDYLDDLDYLFEGNSFVDINPVPIGVVVGVPPNTRFVGGDSTATFLNLDAPLTTQKLLARLQVTTLTPLPPNIGDVFQLSVDLTGTSFLDASFSPVDINTGSSRLGGLIRIVPEPSSLGLIGCSLVGLFIRVRKKRI